MYPHLLKAGLSVWLAGLLIACSGGEETASVKSQGSASLPTISFAASDTTVDSGAAVTLSWASADAEQCVASGGWTGEVGLDGSYSTGDLARTTDFSLACTGLGGTSTSSVRVAVMNSDPGPAVALSAQTQLLDAGDSTTLSWSSTNADQCQASGAWNGTRGTSGSESTGVLNSAQTYTLTCSGAGGNAMAMIAVNVNGVLSLTWVAPTENVDGSALTDLARYKIYYGENSRNYSGSADVNDAGTTSFSVTVPSGSYYVAMTAIDADNNESAYSNEVLKATD